MLVHLFEVIHGQILFPGARELYSYNCLHLDFLLLVRFNDVSGGRVGIRVVRVRDS